MTNNKNVCIVVVFIGQMMGLTVAQFDHTLYGENGGHEWTKWVQSFEICMTASGIADDDRKLAMLLHMAGPKVQNIYSKLPDEKQSQTPCGPLAAGYIMQPTAYEHAVDKLNEYFLPKQNDAYERHVLRLMRQEEDETIGAFVMRLRPQAEHCNFGENVDEHIKDQIIEKCRAPAMRREMLKHGDCDLEGILKIAKTFELVAKQEKVFAKAEPSAPSTSIATALDVNKIGVEKKDMFKRKRFTGNATGCPRCGFANHRSADGKCPAMGKTCNRCQGKNHFANQCKSKMENRKSMTPASSTKQQDESYNSAESDPAAKRMRSKTETDVKYVADNDYVFCISTINEVDSTVKCTIGQVEATAVIDSGSKYNLLDYQTWTRLKSKNVVVSNQQKGSSKSFKSYGGHALTVIGVFTAHIKAGSNETTAEFYVMKDVGKILIGRETATRLKLLKIGYDVNHIGEKSNKAIGKIKGVMIDIPLRKDVEPVVQPFRRMAVPIEKAVDDKVEELIENDVVEKVNKPSKWVSPIVAVPKDDGKEVRICLDMRRANEAVQRENYPLPTMDSFLPYINHSKWFAKYDIKQAFHQIEISEKSREITTFITRKGMFRYKRLMFGIACAPEIFQKVMDQMLSGCEGCLCYIDDVLVFAPTKEELQKRSAAVLDVLNQNDVVLNEEKCVECTDEIEFLGHRLNGDGIRPTQDKVAAIKSFRQPKSSEEVRSYLGLATYVGKFIPDLATITEALRMLTRKDEPFRWETEQEEAFQKLKGIMSDKMTLGYYDVNDRTQLYCDASPVGLGAVLVQLNGSDPRVISYASKSLSDVEKRYCQTEKEALSLVWGTERFYYYLFGRSFELVTDHKPLETIFGMKSKPCARIERWVLRLQSYAYKVVYKSGKNNIADPLSRLVVDSEPATTFDEEAEHYVNWVAEQATPKALKTSEIVEQSKMDPLILAVKTALYDNVWPDELKPFKLFATELCFAGDILLRGTRIVVPASLREQTIALAHEGHPGICVMKQRLRSKVWWPKIDADAEKCVKSCRSCILVAAPSAPEPMIRKELPQRAWDHLAMDFMGPLPSGHHLFVIVDYYSRFIEVEVMTKINADEAIKRLRVIFSRFGKPISITADNARQFIGVKLSEFCEEYNIQLINTTPYWPQQNGEVERQNRSLLKRLMISQNEGSNWMDDLQDYLLMYRASPHSTTLKSPAELMFNRKIRDKIPFIDEPTELDESVRDKDKEMKEKGREYGDMRRNAKSIDIREGDEVVVKRMEKKNKLQSNFEPIVHTVVGRKGSEVMVQSSEDAKIYRRNASHLKKINTDDPSTRETNQPATTATASSSAATTDPEGSEPIAKRLRCQPKHLQDFV